MARGVIKALNERKVRIPEEIAVIGFDDAPFAEYLSPALSSVSPPHYAMGAAAFQSMCDLLGRKKPQDSVLPCKLVLRESC